MFVIASVEPCGFPLSRSYVRATAIAALQQAHAAEWPAMIVRARLTGLTVSAIEATAWNSWRLWCMIHPGSILPRFCISCSRFFPSFTTLVHAVRLEEVGNERFWVSLSSPGHSSISNLCYWEASSNLTRLKLTHWKINRALFRFQVFSLSLYHIEFLDTCMEY